jgi:hypothetical protein
MRGKLLLDTSMRRQGGTEVTLIIAIQKNRRSGLEKCAAVDEDLHSPLKAFRISSGRGSKEGIGDLKFAPGNPDPRLADGVSAKRSQFRHRLIAVAKYQCLTWGQFG